MQNYDVFSNNTTFLCYIYITQFNSCNFLVYNTFTNCFFYFTDPSEVEWPDGVPSDEDCLKFANIHYLLNILLIVIPMCKELLLHSLRNQFPYHTKSTHIHEYYIHNLLWILEYQPTFRHEILHLIFSK